MDTLLAEIELFLAENGISASRFGFLAARNSRLVERLRNGGRVWPDKEAEIRRYMESRRSSQEKAA